jgi:hypothetical protein
VTAEQEEDGTQPRTVSGWKATLVAIGLIVVVFSILNLLARPDGADRDGPQPSPSVVTTTPR